MVEIARDGAPEFRTPGDIEAWLRDKPRDWCVALATRTALRILPQHSSAAAAAARNVNHPQLFRSFLQLTGAAFRGVAIGTATVKYPTAAIDHAHSASISVARAIADYGEFGVYTSDAATANATDAIRDIGACISSIAAANTFFITAAIQPAWVAVTTQDALFLASGGTPSALITEPLWRSGGPDWAVEAWARLRDALPEGEHWEVWTDWYAARLKKSRWSKRKELIYASVPLDVWERGHVAANTWIYEELQKLKQKKKLETDDASPKLVGAHTFVVADGQIDARKNDGRPDFPAVARTFYETARRRAQELAERIKSWQADTKLEGKVAQLLEHLTENPDEATLGYLIASMLALQAEHRNWNNEEGRKEIPLDLLTLLDETAEAVASYVSGFEIGHKILASRLAFDLKIERGALERVQAATQEIKAIAQASPVVKPSVVEALDEPLRAARNARDDKERAEQLSLGLTELTGFLRAATKGVEGFVSRTVKKIDEKGPDAIADGVVKGAGKAAKHVTYGAIVSASIGVSVWATGLGEEGVALIKDTWHQIGRITPELKSGNPIQKLEKQMRERVEEAERAAPAEPPVAESPSAKTPRSSKPKAPRKKK